jgi:catechol 2,3-dioxygenase-like lactoylglutathione lyase family enzyme
MRQHINGIDHVVIVVRDLDAARDAFGKMGFTVTPRGYHTLGSQNHCVMFGHDYIELLWSPEDTPHPSRQYYTEFARAGAGLAAIALKTDSAKGAYTEMLWSGFAPSDPVEFSRPVEVSEGKCEARFRVSMAAPDRTPGGRMFVCEHLTRDVVWRPEYQRHANGATGIAAVAIVADDVTDAARPTSGSSQSSRTDRRGLKVRTGDAPIAFVTARSLAAAPERPDERAACTADGGVVRPRCRSRRGRGPLRPVGSGPRACPTVRSRSAQTWRTASHSYRVGDLCVNGPSSQRLALVRRRSVGRCISWPSSIPPLSSAPG